MQSGDSLAYLAEKSMKVVLCAISSLKPQAPQSSAGQKLVSIVKKCFLSVSRFSPGARLGTSAR